MRSFLFSGKVWIAVCLFLTAAGGIPLGSRLDPQYLQALSELSETRRIAGSDFHRWRDQMQWSAVQQTVHTPGLLSMDGSAVQHVLHERYDLVRAVEKYPLWERMPGHAAISTRTLNLWQISRKNFLQLILKRLP